MSCLLSEKYSVQRENKNLSIAAELVDYALDFDSYS
jgi:hypothetical protein